LVYDIPMALNLSSAEIIMKNVEEKLRLQA
jgi:methylglyoxal synthase